MQDTTITTEMLEAAEEARDTIILPHDGLILLGSRQAFADESRNVVGIYIDRLGNPQRIFRGSIYGSHLRNAMERPTPPSAEPAPANQRDEDGRLYIKEGRKYIAIPGTVQEMIDALQVRVAERRE